MLVFRVVVRKVAVVSAVAVIGALKVLVRRVGCLSCDWCRWGAEIDGKEYGGCFGCRCGWGGWGAGINGGGKASVVWNVTETRVAV